MKTRTKLTITRELVLFFISIGIGVSIFGFGDIIGDAKTKKIGVFIAIFSYIFYAMFRYSYLWFKRCNRYPLDE